MGCINQGLCRFQKPNTNTLFGGRLPEVAGDNIVSAEWVVLGLDFGDDRIDAFAP